MSFTNYTYEYVWPKQGTHFNRGGAAVTLCRKSNTYVMCL